MAFPQPFDRALSDKTLAGTFPGNLDIEILDVNDAEAVGRMPVDKRHLHAGGYVHGAVWVALADTVAAWGTMHHIPEGASFTTAELKVNVIGASRLGDELHAIATPLHTGKRTHVWEVRIRRGDQLMANFVCTQIVLSGKA